MPFHGAARHRCVWRTLEEERYRHLQNVGDLLQPARSNAVGAVLVLLHLLEGEAERIAQFVWLIASILRRMRTRRPTCTSVEFGPFFAAVVKRTAMADRSRQQKESTAEAQILMTCRAFPPKPGLSLVASSCHVILD